MRAVDAAPRNHSCAAGHTQSRADELISVEFVFQLFATMTIYAPKWICRVTIRDTQSRVPKNTILYSSKISVQKQIFKTPFNFLTPCKPCTRGLQAHYSGRRRHLNLLLALQQATAARRHSPLAAAWCTCTYTPSTSNQGTPPRPSH